jgi:uncharacterized heparinase superfamily protein
VVPALRPIEGDWIREPFDARKSRTAAARFRFLNQEREVATWDDLEVPLLWIFNLNYFETPESDLIEDFVRRSTPNAGRSWHPYPLSLRIANWIKWCLRGEGRLSNAALTNLAQQAGFLSTRVEYHLLANHLLANAKALVFAGCFLEGQDAAHWLCMGLKILRQQLPEQILADGAHFERSPMYHALLTQDLLDLINLGRCYPDLLRTDIDAWIEIAGRMCGWLRTMTHPDGEIALFNDAAFGIARRPDEVLAYAEALDIVPIPTAAGASGYVRLENRETVVIFDAAPIGPDYQPGHAHADTLSFELSHRGHRQIVNSGTSTYEAGEDREYERGTAAHNCLVVDGKNQSEVWSAFRVARRAYPAGLTTDHRSFGEATHDGYKRLRQPVVHRRRLDLSERELLITDELQGSGKHEVEIFFHLDPDAQIRIEADPKLEAGFLDSDYRPEFNARLANRTFRGSWRGNCPVIFRTRIALP